MSSATRLRSIAEDGPIATEASRPLRTSIWPFIGWLGFSMLLLYVILLGGSWLGLYVGWTRIVDLVIASVGLVIWLLVAWRRPEWRPTTAIWPAFVAGLGAMLLSLAFSPFPRLGVDYVAWAVLLVALYLMLVRILAWPYVQKRVGPLLAAMAFVLGVAYLAWTAALWVEWWELVGEIRMPPFRPAHLGMTWGSPSVVVTVQVLMVTAAAGGLGFASRGSRFTIAVLVVLTSLMALISGSRSSWLALAGAVLIVSVIAVARSRAGWLPRLARASRAPRSRAVAGGLLIVVAALALTVGPAMLDRLGDYGDGGRPAYWATALRMFASAPLLGLGPGTWMVRRLAYAEQGELDAYQPHAHDQYLQAGAELGLVGLAAGIVAVACVGWLIVGALRWNEPLRHRWAWASTFGVAYLALNVVVDVHTIPTVALLLAIPIAALDATSPRGIRLPSAIASSGQRLRAVAIGALVIGCLIAVAVLARSESVAMTNARAVEALDAERWGDALAPAADAASADPDFGVYQVSLGLAALGTGDRATAERAYQAAVSIDDLPASWLGLALAQAELGRPKEEITRALERAMRMGEQQAAVTFGIGQVYDRIGSTEEAEAAYAKTVGLLPSLAADDAWRATFGRERLGRILARAMDDVPGVAWEIALMDGDAGLARELAEDSPMPDLAGLVVEAWEGDADAADALRSMAARSPEDGTVLAWAARISDRTDGGEAGDRYRRLIRLGPHYAPPDREARIAALGTDPRDDNVGIATFYYGPYLYRRDAPVDILPPGLLGLRAAEGA